MGYLRKNEIKSAKRPPHTFIHMNPFPEILDPPLHNWMDVEIDSDQILDHDPR